MNYGAITLMLGILMVSGMMHYVRNATVSGQLDRNGAIGIRTRSTQASDEAWLVGHRAAGPWLFVAAVTGYVSAVLIASLQVAQALAGVSAAPAIVLGLATLIVIVVMVIIGGMKASSAARGVNRA